MATSGVFDHADEGKLATKREHIAMWRPIVPAPAGQVPHRAWPGHYLIGSLRANPHGVCNSSMTVWSNCGHALWSVDETFMLPPEQSLGRSHDVVLRFRDLGYPLFNGVAPAVLADPHKRRFNSVRSVLRPARMGN